MRINQPFKTVEKPYGKEIWLELNDKYCMKLLFILAGKSFSFQYHEYKTETMYIVKGIGSLFTKDIYSSGANELRPNYSIHIKPNECHQIKAKTDMTIIEASTPEVWDVVRISDKYGRE